jgi:outer membrane receptor protein involved in Fe transport
MKDEFMRVIILSLFLLSINAFSQTGFISGRVSDSGTNEPLPGVNIVIIEQENTGGATNTGGDFIIKVPVGSYSVKASLIGYATVIKTDVIVKTGQVSWLPVQLSETSLELSEISVKADYFDRALMENNLSTIVLGAEEVKRSPGSLQDFQRILQSLAGVSFSKDKTNELLVRGGSPDENLTVLDNIEIHSTNHYPNEINSGGPINMINVDMIQDISFSTGGFISKYGDKLSSVINISTREGNRLQPFKVKINLLNTGIGTIMEGAINQGQGSWIVSIRKSYADLIKDVIGLSSAPEYYDIQFKLAYEISPKHKIICSGIYGNDRLFDEGESDNTDIQLAGKTDSVSLYKEDINQFQYAIGTTLRSIWSGSLFSLLTIYYSRYSYNNSETELFTARNYNTGGEVYHSELLKSRLEYAANNSIGSLGIKCEYIWNLTKDNQLEFGALVKTDEFMRSSYTCGDSTRYDILENGWDTPDDKYILQVPSTAEYQEGLFKNQKSYAFLNDRISLSDDRLILNLGLRYDYFSYNNKGNFSPRFSITYCLSAGLNNVNFAYGDYYQTQNYPTYMDRYKSEINRYLNNTHARHFVLGYNHILDEGLMLTLEGYLKKYYDIPVREDFIHYNDRTFRSEKIINMGRQSIYGIDFLIQQKMVKNYYGTISYSRMWSKVNDPRIGMEGNTYPSDYDYPHIFSIVFGRRFSSLREKLNNAPFYIKYPSYLLPFSNDMEISARWRFASGRAYTPQIFITTEQFYEGGSRWSRGNWISSDKKNSERYADYHRLDLSFSSRYNFENWSLTVYLSVENIYNRKNVASYHYNSDGSRETKFQYSIFPVVGIDVEL